MADRVTRAPSVVGLLAVFLVLVAGCVPMRSDIVEVPRTNGAVVDGKTGKPVAGAKVRLVEGGAGRTPDLPAVFTGNDGSFVHPLHEARIVGIAMPGAGTYRDSALFSAQTPERPIGFGKTSFIQPIQKEGGYAWILLLDRLESLTSRETFSHCTALPREDYAYTLALELHALAGRAWFREESADPQRRIDRLGELIRPELNRFAYRCGVDDRVRWDLLHEYNDWIEAARTRLDEPLP